MAEQLEWMKEITRTDNKHEKSVRIRSYSGPYFLVFGLNAERYSVSLRIQSECGELRTRITPIFIYFLFILYLFNIGKKRIQLKVYRRNSFSIKKKLIKANGPLKFA